MKTLWGRDPPDSYERVNKYFTAVHLDEAIERAQPPQTKLKLRALSDRIWQQYRELWDLHQQVAKTIDKEWTSERSGV